MNLPDLGTAGGAMLGGVGISIGFVLLWLRKVSRHGVGMKNDEAEVGMISRQQQEIERLAKRLDVAEAEAKRERDQRITDVGTIASLLSDGEWKDKEIDRLTDRKQQAEQAAGFPSTRPVSLRDELPPRRRGCHEQAAST